MKSNANVTHGKEQVSFVTQINCDFFFPKLECMLPTIKVSADSSFILLSSDLRTLAAGAPLLLNLV